MSGTHPAKILPFARRSGDSLAARDDDALMLLASAGRRDAFRVLVERHALRVVRFCTRMTGDPRAGEEIAQEAWLSVWAARANYEPRGSFVTWLLVSAKNRCLNTRRGDARRSRVLMTHAFELAEQAAPEDASQLDRLVLAEETRRVDRALGELSLPLREALTLRYAESLAYEEIAVVTGTNASTARSRVFHGLKKLQERLGSGREKEVR